MTTIEKVLKNNVQVIALEVENDFSQAQNILDLNIFTQNMDASCAYNERVSNDFVATYKVKVERQADFERLENMITREQFRHKREVRRPFLKELQEKKDKVVQMFHKGLYTLEDARAKLDALNDEESVIYNRNCDCKLCKFTISYDEWKTGKMSNGSKVGKSMRKAGIEQEIIDFYSAQIKTEKEVYFTVSDLVQHIAGMSYFCELGSWDTFGGSSCQDPRHEDEDYPIQLGGSLHDNKLFVGFLHESLEDLEDLEDKMLARTVLRYVHIDGKPCLIATHYYGNNETKGAMQYAISQLQEMDIYGNEVIGGYDEIKEPANGVYHFTVIDDVHVYKDEYEYVTCECPNCGGSGNMDVWSERCDKYIEVECPLCSGSGDVESEVHVYVDEWIEVEDTKQVKPYYERYRHYGNYIEIDVYLEEIRNARKSFEE